MKLTQEQIVGILLTISGFIALIFTIASWLSDRNSDLARKITSAQNIIQHCRLPKEEETRIMDILLEAEKKLNIEERYSEAANLINSVNKDLLICDPKYQISEPIVMLYFIFAMMMILGILIATGKLKKANDTKRKT